MLSKILRTLRTAKLLTEDNKALVLSHPFPIPLAQALKVLNQSKILSQELFILMVNHYSPYFLAETLVLLNQSALLNTANRALVSSHPHLYRLLQILSILQTVGLLTDENFNRLVLAEHHALISEEASLAIWASIAPYLTQTHYESLLDAARKDDPIQALNQATERMLKPELNPAQSTHTASIHRSVSRAVQKLMDSYATINLHAELSKIQDFLDSLEDSPKNAAARRAFQRLHRLEDIAIHQLLALVFVAIHDETKLKSSLSDAKYAFIEALYEIQRGYNFNADGMDDGKADAPICLSGSYNKLIEKLHGFHQDVDLHFITQSSASAKFPKLASNHALAYLNSIASPSNATDYQSVKMLLDSLQSAKNISPLWEIIAKPVIHELWDEFAEAYGHQSHHAFIELIDQGKEISLPDIAGIHIQLQASLGYALAHESSPSTELSALGLFAGITTEEAPRARKQARIE